MDTEYTRVIPRDLFNESKLLKCIGQLVLLIHDGNRPNGLDFTHDDEPFDIRLMEDGHLRIANIKFKINGKFVLFKTVYNRKSNYPLLCEHNYCEYEVFDDAGKYTEEFITFCNTL